MCKARKKNGLDQGERFSELTEYGPVCAVPALNAFSITASRTCFSPYSRGLHAIGSMGEFLEKG